jgi:hypothetical protein
MFIERACRRLIDLTEPVHAVGVLIETLHGVPQVWFTVCGIRLEKRHSSSLHRVAGELCEEPVMCLACLGDADRVSDMLRRL